MVPVEGLEPPRSCLKDRFSTKLSYTGVERLTGVEPVSPAWHPGVLPLNQSRSGDRGGSRTRSPEGTTLSTSRVYQFRHSAVLVGVMGFEPTLNGGLSTAPLPLGYTPLVAEEGFAPSRPFGHLLLGQARLLSATRPCC